MSGGRMVFPGAVPVRGDAGFQGPKGDKGDKGDQGIPGINTVIVGTAPIVIGGTAGAPIVSMPASSGVLDGYMSATQAAKLDGIAVGATNYAHPANHAPSIITQDLNNRFVTDAEKTTWNAKQPAGTYATLAGVETLTNKSISGGQITSAVAVAAALQTARTINGVAFDGTLNITINAVDATARIASSLLGVANGVATLDATAKVPATQLPSYVDDVLEYANVAAFPATGVAGILYVALDTNKVYRWSGTVYIYITSGAVDSVMGANGVVTATNLGLQNFTAGATVSGINTGDQTNITGSAATVTQPAQPAITSVGTSLQVGTGVTGFLTRAWAGGGGNTYSALYNASVSPVDVNYALISTGAATYLGGTTSAGLTANGVIIANATTAGLAVTGALSASLGITITGGSYTAGVAKAYVTAADGLALIGKTGSATDFILGNGLGQDVFNVPTGTRNVAFSGAVTIPGSATVGTTLSVGSYVTAPNLPYSVEAYGAIGDYVPTTGVGTDDRAAIQAALNAAYAAGGGVVKLGKKKYKLAGPISIPVGVILQGPYSHPQSGYVVSQFTTADPETNGGRKFRNMGSALWVCFDAGRGNQTTPNAANPTAASDYTYNAAYDITNVVPLGNYATRNAAIYVGGALTGCCVFQACYDNGLAAAVTDGANWNSAWNVSRFAGLAIRQNAEDATVQNCFVGGFMQGILSYNYSRGLFDNIQMDCMNCIEASSVKDVQTISNIHGFPFSAISGVSSLIRRGTFMWLHDTWDWGRLESCFTYGHKNGVMLFSVNSAQLSNIAVDQDPTLVTVGAGAELTGSYGLYLSSCVAPMVSNLTVTTKEFGLSLYLPGNCVTISGLNAIHNLTAVSISAGNLTLSGPFLSAGSQTPASWAYTPRVGVVNSGTGRVALVNSTFDNLTTNTSNTGTGSIASL